MDSDLSLELGTCNDNIQWSLQTAKNAPRMINWWYLKCVEKDTYLIESPLEWEHYVSGVEENLYISNTNGVHLILPKEYMEIDIIYEDDMKIYQKEYSFFWSVLLFFPNILKKMFVRSEINPNNYRPKSLRRQGL